MCVCVRAQMGPACKALVVARRRLPDLFADDCVALLRFFPPRCVANQGDLAAPRVVGYCIETRVTPGFAPAREWLVIGWSMCAQRGTCAPRIHRITTSGGAMRNAMFE